jgi:hypothetical protein
LARFFKPEPACALAIARKRFAGTCLPVPFAEMQARGHAGCIAQIILNFAHRMAVFGREFPSGGHAPDTQNGR